MTSRDKSTLNRSTRLLTHFEWDYLTGSIGPDDWRRRCPTLRHVFAALEAGQCQDGSPITEELWRTHSYSIVREWSRERPGERPPLFFKYDAPQDRCPGETDVEFLDRHDLLTIGERRRISGLAPVRFGARFRIKERA